MTTHIKESLTYAFLTIFVSVINTVKLVIVDPCKGLYNLMAVTPKSRLDKLEKKYRGKTCLITGGSSGIGMELAKLLSSLGATIIVSARSMEKLDEVASQCRLQYPKTQIFPIVLDLEKYDRVEEYTKTVLDKLQSAGLPCRIDVLINNAGMSSRGTAMETNMETLERLMVNA